MSEKWYVDKLEKHDYDYEKIEEDLAVIVSCAQGMRKTVEDGKEFKDDENSFYKWRMQTFAELTVMNRHIQSLFDELHLDFFVDYMNN